MPNLNQAVIQRGVDYRMNVQLTRPENQPYSLGQSLIEVEFCLSGGATPFHKISSVDNGVTKSDSTVNSLAISFVFPGSITKIVQARQITFRVFVTPQELGTRLSDPSIVGTFELV